MTDFLMSKSRKDIVSAKARSAYLATSRRFLTPHLNKSEILRLSLGETKARLIETKKFNSILGTLALSIALRLAERLIAKWLEENLYSYDAIKNFEGKAMSLRENKTWQFLVGYARPAKCLEVARSGRVYAFFRDESEGFENIGSLIPLAAQPQ